jgi:predicted site-specific integrase-resolvase
MNNQNLITLEDYARLKKVSLKTIYNWINAGKLKPVIIGKHKFINNEKNN